MLVFSPVLIFISSLVSLLENGSCFYLLRPLSWTACTYFDEGGATDSEHMETDTKAFKCLPLHDLGRSDSESDILSHDISVPMWRYPGQVSLARILLNFSADRMLLVLHITLVLVSYLYTNIKAARFLN